MIIEDEEGNIEENWEEAKIKLERQEDEKEIDEQLVELPEMQEDNEEDEDIDISEVEADQEATKLKQSEKILETGEEWEKSRAHRSSTTQKKVVAREGEFRKAVSTKESCQDMHPEELSTAELQKLKE